MNHCPSIVSSKYDWRVLGLILVQNACRINRLKVAKCSLRGVGQVGKMRLLSTLALHFPFNLSNGIVRPEISARSDIVMTRSHNLQLLATLSCVCEVQIIWNCSIIDASFCLCSWGVHARSIWSSPFKALSLSLRWGMRPIPAYFRFCVVERKTWVTNPVRSW